MSRPGSTIAAIATGPVAGGVGILRLSGPLALEVSRPLAPDLPAGPPAPRHAYFTRFADRRGGVLDEGLYLFFQAPASFTGEDVVELQAHGSPRLLSLLLAEVLADERVRLAEPGEFSRRALLNGRTDLARAEAVADLVAAESEAAVRAAAAQLRGALSEQVQALRRPLLELHADLEGALNFPDEADGADEAGGTRVQALKAQAEALARAVRGGALVRRGAKVALFGPVNAGKSTLFNRLAGEARSLVDDEPGTTRDVLEARAEVGGVGITWLDTAGLRAPAGRVEAMGVERARQSVRSADLAVLLLPPEESAGPWAAEGGETPVLVVRGKADLLPDGTAGALAVSGTTGQGIRALEEAVLRRLTGAGIGQGVLAASERQAAAIRRAAEAIDRAARATAVSTLEVVSGEIGAALDALGEVTGESAGEALLDEIFRRFCIGK